MRITNSTILRGYNRNLNRLQSAKTSSEHKILTGRQFDRASEAPLAAAKALNVRKSLYRTAQYKENLDVASKFYTEAETSLLQVSEEIANIRETIIAAVNTTKDPSTDLQIYAQQLETKGSELCSIFNTNSAERAIFGGESDDAQPFKIQDGVVLYHDVPVNASSDPSAFPYSKSVYIDIGIGLVQNQQTQEIDPQSALKISFNGPEVTGCGAESGAADINTTSLKNGSDYIFNVYVDGKCFEAKYTYGGDITTLKNAITTAYGDTDITFDVTKEGVVSAKKDGKQIPLTMLNNIKSEETAEIVNPTGYTDNFFINFDTLKDGEKYALKVTMDGETKIVEFEGGADKNANIAAINAALATKFAGSTPLPTVLDDGRFNAEGKTLKVIGYSYNGAGDEVVAAPDVEREKYYSNNYIQLTLDAAKALRNGDLEYANGCIDRLVSATENLLVEIADLGCNEEYIDFTISRYDTRELNLKERQKTLEATDLESEITLMKTYEALYNAALQMSSTVVPNSIFNYIK